MIRITDNLSKAAFLWPDRPAFTCDQPSLTWFELKTRAEIVAKVLYAAGIRHE